jgi:hypothetical protein
MNQIKSNKSDIYCLREIVQETFSAEKTGLSEFTDFMSRSANCILNHLLSQKNRIPLGKTILNQEFHALYLHCCTNIVTVVRLRS